MLSSCRHRVTLLTRRVPAGTRADPCQCPGIRLTPPLLRGGLPLPAPRGAARGTNVVSVWSRVMCFLGQFRVAPLPGTGGSKPVKVVVQERPFGGSCNAVVTALTEPGVFSEVLCAAMPWVLSRIPRSSGVSTPGAVPPSPHSARGLPTRSRMRAQSAPSAPPFGAASGGTRRLDDVPPAASPLPHFATAAAITALRSLPAVAMTSAIVPPNIMPMSPTSSWEM
jgi:hypothetical protein